MMLAIAWIVLKASLDNMREVSTIDCISSALGKVRVKIRCSIMQQGRKVGENCVFHHYSEGLYFIIHLCIFSQNTCLKRKIFHL